MLRECTPMPRRGFLSGLAALPLIGGGVSLIGKPTAAAVPVTKDLLESYKCWLAMEQRMVAYEMAGHDYEASKQLARYFDPNTPGFDWHMQWARTGRGPAGWDDAPQPSTRAALVLSAVGCPLTNEDA